MAQAAKIGPAGCGLGNQVFGADNQILASTTNGTSGNQTFGITSGTSNCVDGSRQARLENFIEMNRTTVSNDIARGQGETITGLTQILGCQDAEMLGTVLKQNYQGVFSRPDISTQEIANGIQNTIEKSTELTRSCGNV